MAAKKKLITEKDIFDAILKGKKKFEIYGNEIFTPAAKDRIHDSGIKLIQVSVSSEDSKISKIFSLRFTIIKS